MSSGFIATLGDLSTLTEPQRSALADLLDLRAKYFGCQQQLTTLRAQSLRNPGDTAAQTRVDDYSSAVIAPLRLQIAKATGDLLKGVVDLRALKEMVPMFNTALVQYVDIAKLFVALGIPQPTADAIAQEALKYASNDDFSAFIQNVVKSLKTTDLATLPDAFDVDGLKATVPALLFAVLRMFNIGLLLAVSGIDPDYALQMVGKIREYLSTSTDSNE